MKEILYIIVLVIHMLLSMSCVHAKDLSVTFINPGSADDVGVWHMVSKFMRSAADDLNIELEVLYSNRNHIKMIDLAEKLRQRSKSPDYVIVVNEKSVGKQILGTFKNSTSRVMFIHNGLTDQQRSEVGNERDPNKNWIGTITTDDYQAGFKLIRELYRHSEEEPKIVGITGPKSTPVSLIRLQGVIDYIEKAKKGKHSQIVYGGNWSYEDGKEKASLLLKRHNDINIIWAANDSMALGAYDASKELIKERSILVGGLGGFPFALDSIRQGGMKLTVAGHPMIGAWALVLIYDYHNGLDFSKSIGVNYSVDHLTVIDTPEKADQYQNLVLNHPQQIDFRKFSKILNHRSQHYDFHFQKVIEAAR